MNLKDKPANSRLFLKKQKEFLLDQINDHIRTNKNFISHFLTEEEQTEAINLLKKRKCDYYFEGGYNEAQRKVLIIPNISKNLKAIKAIKINTKYKFTHQQVLGSLMSLGIKRDTIGDIAFFENTIQIVVLDYLAEYIKNELNSISSFRVEPEIIEKDEIVPFIPKFKIESFTAASNRLDCIIASCFKMSRKQAIETIKTGIILLNHAIPSKRTIEIKKGDVLSIRKKGKIEILNIGEKTKKGRIRFNIKRFK